MSIPISTLADLPIALSAVGARVDKSGRNFECRFFNTAAIRYMVKHGRDSIPAPKFL